MSLLHDAPWKNQYSLPPSLGASLEVSVGLKPYITVWGS